MSISRLRGSTYLTPLKYHNVRIAMAATFVETLAAAYLVGYYLKILVYDIGGAELLGIYSALGNTLLWLSPIVGGIFSDAFGRRKTLLACLPLSVFSLLMFAILRSPMAIVVLALLLQASFTITAPARAALLSESIPLEYVGRAFSLLFFTENIVSTLSYVMFGYIVSAANASTAFIASGLLFSASLALSVYVQETLKQKRTRRLSLALSETIAGGIRFIVRQAPLLLLLLYLAFEAFTSSIAAPFTPAFLKDVLFLSIMEISTLYTICGVATIIGALMAGFLVDRHVGGLLSLIIRDVLSFPLLLTFALTPPPMAVASLVFLAFIEQLRIGLNQYLVEKTEQEHRSLVMGLISAVRQVSGIPSPLLGILLWKISPRITYVAIAATMPVGIIMLLMVLKIDKKLKLPAEGLQQC
ncbi:MAG: MFS transporter [Candidatus Brockarchaeota archaeon]|nr:MFS transporter [Candidatus Brockarchaeota archaeon]